MRGFSPYFTKNFTTTFFNLKQIGNVNYYSLLTWKLSSTGIMHNITVSVPGNFFIVAPIWKINCR